MVTETVNKMKNSKAPGPKVVVVVMLKAGGDSCIDIVNDLVNPLFTVERFPQIDKSVLLLIVLKRISSMQ